MPTSTYLTPPMKLSTGKPDATVSVVPMRRRQIACSLLLPTLGVLILTAGLGLTLVFYLFAKKIPGQTFCHIFVNGSLYADEGLKRSVQNEQQEVNLRGLLITSLTGLLISFSVPMIMGMVAFRFAAQWVSHADGSHLPTPQQYGLLLTCSSGSLVSLYQCARYIFTSRPGKLTTSSLVIQSFCVLAIISTLSVAIGLVDTWLHAVSSAVLYSQVAWATSDALSSPTIAYGTQFNASACNELGGAFCGQEDESLWTADPSILLKGFAAASNVSTMHLITTLNDEGWMAIVTRPGVLENVTYTASSIGLTASCVAFTSECLVSPPSPVEVTVDCSNIGLPGVPVGQNTIFLEKSGFQVPEGVLLQPQEANSNIFDAQIELYYPSPNINGPAPSPNSAIVSGVSPKQPSNGTGATPGYLLLANCTFAAYDIDIYVTPGAGTALVRKSNASDETTGRLWPGLLYHTILNGLIGNTLGIAMTSDSKEQVMANLSQEIARLTVATVAGILAPTVPEAAGIVSSRLVSAYPIAPLALFLVLLFVYSIIVIILFVWSASASSPAIEIRKAGEKSRTVSLMQLAQMRLTNPLSFVASVFNQPSSRTLHFQKNDTDPADHLLSLETDVQKLFDESANTDPLVAAFSAADNHLPMFEIKRQSIRDGDSGGL